MEYDCNVLYQRWNKNLVTDAQYKWPPSLTLYLLTTTTISYDFLDKVKTKYSSDSSICQLLHQLQTDPFSYAIHMLKDSVL